MTLRRRDLPCVAAASLGATQSAAGAVRRYPYEVWDVFSSTPLQGNQLAVFLDGHGLTPAEMLAITREMSFSETTFILPRASDVEADRGVQVRIFTRAGEVPFAGHPALGTAMSIRSRMAATSQKVVLDLQAGPIPVTFSQTSQGIFGEMLQNDPVFAETHDRDRVASLIGVPAAKIRSEWPIVNVSTGRPNLIVPVDSLATIRVVRMNWPDIESYFSTGDRQRGFYLLTRETESRTASFHARKLTPSGEDPATGSAAGCAAAWAIRYGLIPSGQRFGIEQGNEMHRPGMLYAQAARVQDRITDVRVGGHAVKVAEGVLTLR